jgi:hypothetical protein
VDLRLVDSGLVERRLGWIFVASATFFFLFFVMLAAGGVGIMGNDWLAGAGHGGEKLSIFSHMLFYFFVGFFIPHEKF